MKKLLALCLPLCVLMSGCTLLTTELNEEIRDAQEELEEIRNEVEHMAEAIDGSGTENAFIPEDITEQELLSAVMPHIEAYNEVMTEGFGAEADYNNAYYGVYPEILFAQTDYPVLGEDDGIVLVSGDEDVPQGYVMDPAWTSYFPVTNYSTEDEIEHRYESFMDEDLFEDSLDDRFFEYKDKLYLVSFARGYGAEELVMSSAQVVSKNNISFSVKVDKMLFEEPADDYVVLNFVKTPDGYRIVSVQNNYVADYGAQ